VTVDTAYRVRPLRQGDPRWLGHYRLTGRLGSGGMGVVYLAEDPTGALVAVKLVHANLAGQPEFRNRFRSEVNRARQVPSFCTAEVLDADLDHNPPYLVVEYVDGPSLAEVVEERGPLAPAYLHSVAVGVATALAGIHGAGVIHRDLKPENVLLAPGSPKVIDFGIARAFEATSQHTRTDQFVGTVAYMAPERFSSEPGTPLTAAADIFAWGCVVGYAGTGRTPFHGDSAPATAGRILTQAPHLNGLSEPLRGLVELSLAKDPQDRPSARELLDLLLEGRAPVIPAQRAPQPAFSPPPAPLRPPASPPRSRGRRWLALLAILLVLAGIGTVAAVVRSGQDIGAALTSDRPPDDPTTAVVTPNGSPGAQTTAKPQQRPAPVEPTGGEPIIRDPLSKPGLWTPTRLRADQSRCDFGDGALVVVRAGPGVSMCPGPSEEIEDDLGIAIDISLRYAGSCAALWFHWSDGDGGDVLRVCQRDITVGSDAPGDQFVYGKLPLTETIALSRSTRLHVVVRDRKLDVWRDGDYTGSVRLPEDGPDKGRVELGIEAHTPSTPQRDPYAVTFGQLDIRSL
jgi:eukaryotic-like serine/threonine-protein kinase